MIFHHSRRWAALSFILAAGLGATIAAASPGAAGSFVPAPGAQGERREDLMARLHREPYPADGPWRYVGTALGSYWEGDSSAGDKAIRQLEALRDKAVSAGENALPAENGFHWQAYELERILFLFGRQGVFKPGVMGPEAEAAAKRILWQWLQPRARRILVDPAKDWWLWGSENHHLQAWSSMWGALQILAGDPAYAQRTFQDGTTVAELKPAFDDYFKRWIRHRATRGLFVECNSPTYGKYSLSGFYNLVDFSDDAELRNLARQFLDLCWTQWALEQIDGIRAGSRHRSYSGSPSILGGSDTALSWYHFGVGDKKSADPGAWCTATSSYLPPDIVAKIVKERPSLGDYEITSRQPGLSATKGKVVNYVDDPSDAMYSVQGVSCLDPACRNLLRITYATPGFILGSTMLPALSSEEWTEISSQNRWDGAVFSGVGSPRIFVQPKKPVRGSVYNTQWSVQDRGVLILQGLQTAKSMEDQRIFFSQSLTPKEVDGWIFVEAPQAYAAIKVLGSATTWEPDTAAEWRDPKNFRPSLGQWLVLKNKLAPIVIEVEPKSAAANFAAFQAAILRNPLHFGGGKIEYQSGFYRTTLTLFTDYAYLPLINGKTIDFNRPQCFDSPYLRGDFGGSVITLNAFGVKHVFQFK